MTEETDSNTVQKENKVSASVLDAFDLLKAPKDDAKLNGGSKIISQLHGSENEKDLQYVLKRLVRSLGANVPNMRTGYFATLVALLSNFEGITIPQLLELVKKELHSNGSSKSEVGDVALGQILVCGAIFRSKLILKCSSEEQGEVIQLLMAAGKKKSYLSTVAYLILLDFLKGVDIEQFASVYWPLIKQDFKKDLKEHTLDSLYFLMVINTKFPAKVKLRKLIGSTDVLSEDNIHTVCEKMMTGIDFNSIGHPIYKEVATNIANSPHLQLFWTSGIDSQLVKHNRNRELVAINILTTVLHNINTGLEVLPELVSRNFFKLFMDWFKGLQTASKIRSKRDNEDDNKIMIKKQKELLNALAKALKSDQVEDSIRVEILQKLLFNPGEMNFAEITGTTVVKSIISDLKKDGVKKMAKLFKGVLLNTSKKFLKENVERNWYNNERVKAAELLSYLVSHEAIKDDTEFKLTYMKLLMCFGFFKIGGDDNVAVSSELSGAIKSCFYRCFTSRFSNVDNLVTVLSSLSSFICNILQKEQVRAKIEKQFPKENMECWEMLQEVCGKIEENNTKTKVDKVFLILLYQLGLFLFSEPVHVKIARSSIKELKSCYEHYKKGKKKQSKAKKEDLSADPEWIEVLVEVLLSILSAESSVLRSVVQCVFRLLWEYLTPSAVGQIVSVLDPENESNPLTQEDSESENEDEDNPVQENGKESDEESEEEEEESESDGDDEADDDDEEEMRTPEQLRIAVQKALGSAALESDAESVDADMIDEEEGKKLDEALAEAFKQFHQSKGKKSKKDRKDKKSLSDFRIRVLDLVDIYLEKDPSMDICLGMIAPLTRCLEFCIQDSQFSELENRVRKTIKNLTKIRKFSSVDDIDMNILCDHLKSVIEKDARSHFLFQALGDVITFFATFIIHCSEKIDTKKSKVTKSKAASPLTDIFKESLQNYFQNRNCMLPIIFFHNVLQTDWDGSYALVPTIIQNVFNKNVRLFRRNEGLELLSGFYRSLKRSKPTSDKLIKQLISLETEFETTLVDTLKNDSEFSVKNNFFIILRKLINIMQGFHESCQVETKLNFKSLLEVVGSCKATVKTVNNKQIQDTQAVKKTKPKKNKKKRKFEQMNGNAEPQQKKIKKSSESE
ncbi:myb-binding protein 1A-like protein [Trichoplusia ni]|uniref:Myb-binding protein 1A-like protein n=1 Tax=Trichoplusia ni TaxID=7111 RepID=A0A7E5WJ99_TRINI|nr:myb-binding protein 1A-like protein [Trichoplusia ni]